MNLIDDAIKVAKRAWSMRFIYASIIFGAIDQGLAYFAPEHASGAFGALTIACSMAAGVSRLVAQPKMQADDVH